MRSDTLLTTADLAAVLGVPLVTLRRNIGRLRRDHGFPQPVPCMGHRYDPLAIDRWRREQAGLLPIASPPPSDASAVPAAGAIPDWQDELDRRAERMAQGGQA